MESLAHLLSISLFTVDLRSISLVFSTFLGKIISPTSSILELSSTVDSVWGASTHAMDVT